MTPSKRLVGLLGGTFDPVHESHVAIAQHVLSHYPVDAVQCMPNALSPHRKQVQASDAHRLQMLTIALADLPGITINTIELEHNRRSQTVTTLRLLHQKYPDITWCFIIGVDAFNDLNTWDEWEVMIELCHLIVVGRHDNELTQSPWQSALLAERQVDNGSFLSAGTSGRVVLDPMMPVACSSTQIKAQLKQQQSVTGLPCGVADYIEAHHLYRS